MVEYTEEQRQAWIAGLDKRFASAGVLIENQTGELLVVKANYKSYWSLPGGIIDAGESPLEAVVREVREEIGLSIEASELNLAMVASRRRQLDGCLSYQFVFRANVIDERLENLTLQASEIDDSRFVSRDEVLSAEHGYSWTIVQWAKKQYGYVDTEIVGMDDGLHENVIYCLPIFNSTKEGKWEN